MNPIWDELTAGFMNGEQLVRVVVRLAIAMLMGSIIGYKRERDGKAAGLRTHIIVALGSALFVLSLVESGATTSDVTRVVQGIATGIGFVGAGCIVKPSESESHGAVRGLTTAADIWLTAAVGVAAGMGRPAIAIIGMLMAIIALTLPRRKGAKRSSDGKDEAGEQTTEDTWDD